MQLKGSVEENVLTLLCWHDRHAPKLLLRLKPELFSTRNYRKIAEVAMLHIQRYSAAPKTHLRDLLEEQVRKGEEGKLLNRILDSMEELAEKLQADYVLGTLDAFIQHRNIKMALEAADDALEDGDIQKAREALYVPDLGGKPASPGIWLHDADAMLRFMDKKDSDLFSSGIDALDDRGVRPGRGEQLLLIAPAKRGKSWFVIACAIANIMRGKACLHISLENSEALTSQRYVQSLFAMTKDKAKTIKTPVFGKDQFGNIKDLSFDSFSAEGLGEAGKAAVAKKLEGMKNRGKLLIKAFPMASLTIAHYNAYLDMLARDGFIPDLVVIDYPDLMKVDSNKLRIDLGVLFKELRGVAVERNHALVVPTQGNRSSASAKVVNATMVAEDYSKIGTADTVLAYSQTAAEHGMGLARVLVAAARGSEDRYIVLVSQSYATGQFCIDSVYMNKYAETEIDKFVNNGEDQADAD
jgi:hypothetical protein